MILYYVLDTETTGLKSGYHEVNQISIIRLDDDEQITIDIAVDHPERAAYQALQVQGKTLKEVKENLKEAVLLILETNRLLNKKELSGNRKIIREQLSVSL